MLNRIKLVSKHIVCLALFAGIGVEAIAHADSQLETTSNQSQWQLLRKKLRSNSFTEYQTPGFASKTGSTPLADGTDDNVHNAYNILWIDYEIASNWKLLYWQRSNVFMAPTLGSETAPGGLPFFIKPRNPRFALRRTNIFGNVANLNTTYDFYVQPGLAPEAQSEGRRLEIGFRTNTSYSVSRCTIGAISELTTSFFGPASEKKSDYYGWLSPWFSYSLNKTFSTMHYFTFNMKHNINSAWSELSIDNPFVQNGINIEVSPNISTTVLLNNYISAPISLSNTWASLWLTMSVL